MNFADRHRRWFDYEQHAHALTLDALRAVSEHLRRTPQVQKAADMFAHIIGARWFWLYRLGQVGEPVDGFFPQAGTFSDLERRMNDMHAVWREYLASLDDGAIVGPIEWEATEGGRFRGSIDDVLTQLFGHSLYHRGQIAMLLRQAGAEPPETDFIFWARESVT
jgi:uncharacterized damage-inducible protein DinB